jgi:predicted transcriptional regulator
MLITQGTGIVTAESDDEHAVVERLRSLYDAADRAKLRATIKSLFEESGLSPGEFSRKIGYSSGTGAVSHYIRSGRIPRLGTLIKIADAFGVEAVAVLESCIVAAPLRPSCLCG